MVKNREQNDTIQRSIALHDIRQRPEIPGSALEALVQLDAQGRLAEPRQAEGPEALIELESQFASVDEIDQFDV